MRQSILGIIFLCCIQPVNAQDSSILIGAGTTSCGKWLEARNDLGSHYQLKQWVFGFMSGRNYGGGPQAQPADGEGIVSFVELYCRNNPLHLIAQAAAAAVQETGGKKALHQWKK